jgi:methionyl-tRNA formyltransferase
VSGPRIVFFGYSDVGDACLALLLARRANVVAVYTHEDTPGEVQWFESVAERAKAAGIPVVLDADLRGERGLDALRAFKPDLLLSCYYREILPADALALAPLGAFNVHGSLLPKYRGRAPVNWAVALGEKETGATLHVMTRLADAGDIVDQEAVPIGPDDLAADVQARVRDAAVRVLERQLDALLAGTAPRRAQANAGATKFGRRKPEDGAIDWRRPAVEVHNLVRAVSHPYPGAFATIGGATVHVWRTRRTDDAPLSPKPAAGTIRVEQDRALAICGDGRRLEILNAQVEGEAELDGPALARRLAALTNHSPPTA